MYLLYMARILSASSTCPRMVLIRLPEGPPKADEVTRARKEESWQKWG